MLLLRDREVYALDFSSRELVSSPWGPGPCWGGNLLKLAFSYGCFCRLFYHLCSPQVWLDFQLGRGQSAAFPFAITSLSWAQKIPWAEKKPPYVTPPVPIGLARWEFLSLFSISHASSCWAVNFSTCRPLGGVLPCRVFMSSPHSSDFLYPHIFMSLVGFISRSYFF